MRAQQLIEQRAVEMFGGRGPGAGDGSEQLDAVADPHLLDSAALGRHDDPQRWSVPAAGSAIRPGRCDTTR